eukprot:356533-Chlamydomonas_euryale.AAC.4
MHCAHHRRAASPSAVAGRFAPAAEGGKATKIDSLEPAMQSWRRPGAARWQERACTAASHIALVV